MRVTRTTTMKKQMSLYGNCLQELEFESQEILPQSNQIWQLLQEKHHALASGRTLPLTSTSHPQAHNSSSQPEHNQISFRVQALEAQQHSRTAGQAYLSH